MILKLSVIGGHLQDIDTDTERWLVLDQTHATSRLTTHHGTSSHQMSLLSCQHIMYKTRLGWVTLILLRGISFHVEKANFFFIHWGFANFSHVNVCWQENIIMLIQKYWFKWTHRMNTVRANKVWTQCLS